MSNSTLQYSCFDKNLSHHQVTLEYWMVSPRLQPLGFATGSVMLLFLVIGLPSNIMIITMILLKKLFRQPTHLLLLSLACADLLLCLLVIPVIAISGFAGGFVLGSSDSSRCKVCQTGVSVVALLLFSLHVLALLSFDRFLFIKYPLRYDKILTQKAVLITITVTCILCVLLALLPLFGIGEINFDHNTFSCSPRFDYMTEITKNIYYMVLLIAEGVFPLSVLLVTNIWVLCIAHRHIRVIYRTKRSIKDATQRQVYHQTLKDKLNQQKFRKQLQLLRMFGVLFISHIIVWIPLIVRTIEAAAAGSDDFAPLSDFVVITTITSPPVLHPLIEACFLPEIRNQLHKGCCKNNRPQTVEEHSCCNNCSDIISAALLPRTSIGYTDKQNNNATIL